ncbi:hypothetical protein B0H17DRAFT_1328981 [Mycena rosella]|uniref:Uncharacterized protein n=1 Tax=Mycena rosella TaxID=1033263 RepID=A0AAD7DQV0_MYCRO|nr:hypothetical protein B0H17DRAFT_1328981 [Mycena rosella]
MHAVVDTIPLLLHTALLLFFAGLVVFLTSVNRILVFIMTSMLLLFFLLYALLTILPVIYPACPYHTPLSGILWMALQRLRRIWFPTQFENYSPSERVLTRAMQGSEGRDQRALRWTLDCLTDDTELLPFIEAIPDAIYGPKGFRRTKDYLFIQLLANWRAGSSLVTRICNFIASTRAMGSDSPLSLRRESAGLKCLWALAMMPASWEMQFDTSALLLHHPTPNPLRITAQLALQFHDQQWCRHLLFNLRDLFNRCPTIGESDDSIRDFKHQAMPVIRRNFQLIFRYLKTELFLTPVAVFNSSNRGALVETFWNATNTLRALGAESEFENTAPTATSLEEIQVALDVLCKSPVWSSYQIGMIIAWLERAFKSPTYDSFEPLLTCNEILAGISVCPSIRNLHLPNLEQSLTHHSFRQGVHQLDVLMRIAFRLIVLSPDARLNSYVEYMGLRNNREAVVYAIQDCDKIQLSRCFTSRLGSYRQNLPDNHPILHRLIHALAILVSIYPSREAVELADEVTKEMHLPQADSPYFTLHSMKTLRDLEQLVIKIVEISHRCSPRRASSSNPTSMALARASLQEICGHPLLRPHYPLFIPDNTDPEILCDSIQTEILHQYLLFASSFMDHCILRPDAHQIAASVFHLLRVTELEEGNHFSSLWGKLDPEAQGIFSEGVLRFIRHLTNLGRLNIMQITVAQDLWKSSIFWASPPDGAGEYVVNVHLLDMERASIDTLIEALIMYKASADDDGPPLDTMFSDQVLQRLRGSV